MPIPTSLIPVPGLVLPAISAGSPSSKCVAIVLHGLGVSKEVQIPEIQRLKASGLHAVAIDAPHHGSRDDGYLQLMDRVSSKFEKHMMMLSIVLQQAAEVAALVSFYREQRKKVAVIGISMGGFSTFALLKGKILPDLMAPMLASPDFRCPERIDGMPESAIELCGPLDAAEIESNICLFLVNAGQDAVVSSSGSEKLVARLKAQKNYDPERVQYLNYPESQHFMRPTDWYDAWDKLTEKLSRLC
ncbi:MAG: alpha/beta fold hydrolase [Candidatus Riflebacteria bacterium]